MKYRLSMIFSIAIILSTTTSITYAKQRISAVIEKIGIQGISLSTDMTPVNSILTSGGYVKVASSNEGAVLTFTKGDCEIVVTKRLTGNLVGQVRYSCKNSHADIETNRALVTLCQTQNNGKSSRRGCAPIETLARGMIRELFGRPEIEADGYKYSLVIELFENRSSQIIASAMEFGVPNKDDVKETVNFATSATGMSNANIREANTAYDYCQKNSISFTQDCSCYADAFLRERMAYGSQGPSDVIHLRLTTKCLQVNKEQARSSCMRFAEISYTNMTPENYCSCYADRFAELIENFQGVKMSLSQKRSLESQARGHCRDLDRGVS